MVLLKRHSVFSLLLALFILHGMSFSKSGIEILIAGGDSLRSQGLYEQAVIEYQRALFFSIEPQNNFQAKFKLGETYQGANDLPRAVTAYEDAVQSAPNDSMKDEASLALASAYLLSGETNLAQLTLIPYLGDESNGNNQALLLSITAEIMNRNWSQADILIERLRGRSTDQDTLVKNLHALLQEAIEEEPLDPELAKLYSTIIPGAGQFYAGDIKNGLNAFAFNGFNIWVIVNNVIQTDYISAALYAAVVAERYYFGNRYRAEQITQEKNREREKAIAAKALNSLLKIAKLDRDKN